MTARATVWMIVDGERDYQDEKGMAEGWSPDSEKSVGDYLTYIATYLREAQDALSQNAGTRPALHSIRKITALGVACMEVHGAPKRKS